VTIEKIRAAIVVALRVGVRGEQLVVGNSAQVLPKSKGPLPNFDGAT
jgi:hypothetical protein